MPKLVEYPVPKSPEEILSQRLYYCDYFFIWSFTDSELEVSGFQHWEPFDEEHDPVLPLIDYIEDWCEYLHPMQALVYRAFDKRASGAIRELWLREVYEDPQLRDTVLLRFPIDIAVEARKCLDAAAQTGWPDHDRFVQCVAMLHAYTGLPSGEKAPAQIAADQALLKKGVAGRVLSQFVRGVQPFS